MLQSAADKSRGAYDRVVGVRIGLFTGASALVFLSALGVGGILPHWFAIGFVPAGLALWAAQRARLPEDELRQLALATQASNAAQRILRLLRERRLHRSVGLPGIELLEECAKQWYRGARALGGERETQVLSPIRSRALEALDNAAMDLVLTVEPSIRDAQSHGHWLDKVEDGLGISLGAPQGSDIAVPWLSEVRGLCHTLASLADEAESISEAGAIEDPSVSVRARLENSVNELRALRQAESEMTEESPHRIDA